MGGARLADGTHDRGPRRDGGGNPADVQAAAAGVLKPGEVLPHLRALGFDETAAQTLAAHFLDAEQRGKRGHGLIRAQRIAEHTFDPAARPERLASEPGYERWHGRGAIGYLVLSAVCDAQLADPPDRVRLVVAAPCFPTGVLGYWTRRLAEGGLVAVLTATSPRRLGHPDGGSPLTGTNPISIGIPSSDGRPVVTDVSMGAVTFGEVLAGAATDEELIPFGGEQAHKAFALAVGLQLLVDALSGGEHFGVVLLVARPEGDPVPALRELAGAVRLPGQS